LTGGREELWKRQEVRKLPTLQAIEDARRQGYPDRSMSSWTIVVDDLPSSNSPFHARWLLGLSRRTGSPASAVLGATYIVLAFCCFFGYVWLECMFGLSGHRGSGDTD
jgi:hypothetical protein